MPGVAPVMYVFLKADLAAPITPTGCDYSALSAASFKSGKGLYRIDLKPDSNGVRGENNGPRNGFTQTLEAVHDQVNSASSEIARAFNNNDYGVIIPENDGIKAQIMYDAKRRIEAAQGGITTDTGKAVGDDRVTSITLTLSGQKYPNFYIETPTGGWDSLLASAQEQEEEDEEKGGGGVSA